MRTWSAVLERHGHKCAWRADENPCGLKQGDMDPVGGGRVRLAPDRVLPNSVDAKADKSNADAWQPLCPRHQVVKKYWDDKTGRLNVCGIVQSASEKDKRDVYEFLCEYFGSRE